MTSDAVDAKEQTVPESPETVVQRLRRTFSGGRTKPLSWRRAQLDGLMRLFTEQEGAIAAAIESDLGRNAMGTFMGDVAPVRAELKHTLAELDGWAAPRKAALPAGQQPGRARIVPSPKGVALVIGAWNFPILLTLQPTVSAIAAGNCVVIKPSEIAPATAELLGRIIPRYVDPAAIAVVNGDVSTGQGLLNERFDHVFFTGSTRVGRIVAEACAPTLTPVTLELGGKSPVIVAADADLEVAARRIAWAKSVNAGQACIAPDYVLVEDSVRPAFVDHLLREMEKAAAAEPAHIVSRGHYERLEGLLKDTGGHVVSWPRDPSGLRFGPAVVTDPAPDSAIMQEEIFGPVLPVLSVRDVVEAVEFVATRPHPLALYLFTGSRGTIELVQTATQSGSFCVNHLLYQLLVPDLPFGGVGPSGLGSYHGRFGFDTFSHLRGVLEKPTAIDPSLAYPPYGRTAESILRRVMG